MKLRTLVLGAVAGLVLASCGSSQSPEEVTKIYVNSIAKGECEKALEVATGQAEESVKTMIEAGCEANEESEVKGEVTCEVEGETATCSCEVGKTMPFKFNYDLEKVDGNWKVSTPGSKDGMDLGAGEAEEESAE